MMPQFVAGSPLFESLWAAGIFLISVLVAWLIVAIMRRLDRRLEGQRRRRLLYRLVESLIRPVFLLVVSQGVILALATPSTLAPWRPMLGRVSIAATLALAAYALGRVASVLLDWYVKSRGVRRRVRIDEGLARLLRRLILLTIYVLAILTVLDYLGVDITAAVAGLGIGGLAVALALQPTLGNFFAGTQIISDRVLRVGDYIELDDGTRGYVSDVGWRSTRIRTPFNNVVIIPNSRLAQSIITNYYGPTMELAVIVDCGVSYDSDLSKVQAVSLEVAREVINDMDEAVKTFEPWFGYEEFGDSNINFWIWMQATDRIASFALKSEVIRRLHARFAKEGITINYPVRRLVYDEGDGSKPPPLPGRPQRRRGA